MLGTANLTPAWEGVLETQHKLVCITCTRERAVGTSPPRVLFALLLMFCRVVSNCQADVQTLLTSYIHAEKTPVRRFRQAPGVSDLD